MSIVDDFVKEYSFHGDWSQHLLGAMNNEKQDLYFALWSLCGDDAELLADSNPEYTFTKREDKSNESQSHSALR